MSASVEQPPRRADSEHLRLVGDKSLRRIRHLFERTSYAKLAIRALSNPRSRRSSATALEHPLLTLYLRSRPIPEDDLRRVLSFAELRALVTSGLLEVSDGRAFALIKVMPYGDLLIASDVEGPAGRSEPDFVMGLSPSTLMLATLTVRRRVQRTLDVGTGSGIQAMLAARHSDHVTAVDVSSRALDFAQFNARLNGITNITFLEGDLFRPVEGQQFDLILCNPPSPDCRNLYSDDPMDDDDLLHYLMQQMPRFLDVSGYGQMVGNRTEHEGQDWRRRLVEWFKGSDCDAWAICGEIRSPESCAATHLEAYKPDSRAAEHACWITNLNERRIQVFNTGLITLRRTAAGHWNRTSEAPRRLRSGNGDDVRQGLEGQDFLMRVDGTSHLLDARLEVSPDVRMNQAAARTHSGGKLAQAKPSRTRGSIDLGPDMHTLLVRLDEGTSLRELLTSEEQTNPDVLATYFAGALQLASHGFLLPQCHDETALDRGADQAHWDTEGHTAPVQSAGANP